MEAGLCLLTGVFEMGDLFVLSCASACAACAGPAPCAEIAESGTPAPPLVSEEFPAYCPLAEPESVANIGLCCARLPQGVNLARVFVLDSTICSHQ